ncbi:hypothetical protein [Hymenobacter sp. GOD-10R]|uniref:hypothetical protein n=1 Tax=Hymenobacter sp. GOD-10R TaxID=3093922 RepID=UPI002D78D5B6|nr:hypothetical protein [Hymenobacter sp. GOD-10R]WRQ31924.1 hypothetical protein SD425_29700 [Hymenobacter sp. GOD-10R]
MPQRLTFLFFATWLLLSLLSHPRATAQVPARPDSARAQMLSTDTRTLRQLDSLRRQTSARLGQLQQELLSLKDRPDRAREQQLAQEFIALRAADSLRRTQARRHIDSLKLRTRGYPVVPHEDTLFYVYTKLGPFSPRERAALIADKVQRLEANVRYQPDSLRLYPSEQTIDLMYGELVVQSISDNDALWMNTPRDSLAPPVPGAHRAGGGAVQAGAQRPQHPQGSGAGAAGASGLLLRGALCQSALSLAAKPTHPARGHLVSGRAPRHV